MCLINREKVNGPIIGYKVFRISLDMKTRHTNLSNRYYQGNYIKMSDNVYEDDIDYPRFSIDAYDFSSIHTAKPLKVPSRYYGWHAFKTLDAAQRDVDSRGYGCPYVIYLVELSEECLIGIHRRTGSEGIVGRHMKLIERVEY